MSFAPFPVLLRSFPHHTKEKKPCDLHEFYRDSLSTFTLTATDNMSACFSCTCDCCCAYLLICNSHSQLDECELVSGCPYNACSISSPQTSMSVKTQTLAVRSASITRGTLNVNAMKVTKWTLLLRPARQKVSHNAAVINHAGCLRKWFLF